MREFIELATSEQVLCQTVCLFGAFICGYVMWVVAPEED